VGQELAMNQNGQRMEPPDLSHFEEGRSQIPAEELAKYAGKCVAFSSDGTRILASGDYYDDVDRQLETLGIHFSQVVQGYIDMPDEIKL
jgi:hypothetical protein